MLYFLRNNSKQRWKKNVVLKANKNYLDADVKWTSCPQFLRAFIIFRGKVAPFFAPGHVTEEEEKHSNRRWHKMEISESIWVKADAEAFHFKFSQSHFHTPLSIKHVWRKGCSRITHKSFIQLNKEVRIITHKVVYRRDDYTRVRPRR